MKANRTLLSACAFIALTTAAIAAESESKTDPNRYLVIDLAPSQPKAKYAVKYLADAPPGGWTDEYKTTKLVLRRIPAGTFTMGSPENELGRDSDETQHAVTLTKDYYIGVCEVTQKQWQQVMGDWAGGFGGRPGSVPTPPAFRNVLPVEQVSYYQIREKFEKPVVAVAKDAEEKDKGVDLALLADDATEAPAAAAAKPPEPPPVPLHDPAVDWPANSVVNQDSFMGRLRAKTGLTALDLPTEAQWEYACRAGTTTALHSGKDLTDAVNCPNLAEVARYRNNAGKPDGWSYMSEMGGVFYGDPAGFQGFTHKNKWMGKATVGSYQPNRWGLYDMHGNVWEWCLDWYAETYPGAVTDPKGPATGTRRVLRGGSSDDIAPCCRSANRGAGGNPVYRNADFGFRVAMTMP